MRHGNLPDERGPNGPPVDARRSAPDAKDPRRQFVHDSPARFWVCVLESLNVGPCRED